MKVVVCTMFSPSHQELADLTVLNMELYARAHRYDTHLIKVENDKWEYKKHEAFTELFEMGYDLIWYRDVDAVITNMNTPIEKFTDGVHSFYLTRDFNELNGGSVIIKNNERGRWFNNLVLSSRNEYENEQNFYNEIIHEKELYDVIRVLPQNAINSYSYDLYHECKSHVGSHDLGDWKEGDLLVHFPGLGMKDRVELVKEYLQKVI